MSTVPSSDHAAELPLSGTSMATPFVTGVASRLKDTNPKLTPKDMREILMQTVDIKDWLKGKVVSSGVVNANRATKAAELAKTERLADAIRDARTAVADMPDLTGGPKLDGRAAGVSPASLSEFAHGFVL
jgi:hypothetical protein